VGPGTHLKNPLPSPARLRGPISALHSLGESPEIEGLEHAVYADLDALAGEFAAEQGAQEQGEDAGEGMDSKLLIGPVMGGSEAVR